MAIRAFKQRAAGELLVEGPVILGFPGGGQRLRWNGQESPAKRQVLCAEAVAEQPIVPDALQAAGEHMEQEAADELLGIMHHDLLAVMMPVILPVEGHLAVLGVNQPVVGDGDTMGIAAKILQHLFGAAEGPFGINHPLDIAQGREVLGPLARIGKRLKRRCQCEPPRLEGLLQPVEEQPAEEPREHPHREEEAGFAGNPPLAVRRQPPTGDDAMQMGMVQQVLPPGVEHGNEADLGAEVLGVGGDGAERLGRGAEEEVVDLALVLEGNRGDGGGEGEDHMEIPDGQKLRTAVFQPLRPRQ